MESVCIPTFILVAGPLVRGEVLSCTDPPIYTQQILGEFLWLGFASLVYSAAVFLAQRYDVIIS